MAVVAAKDLRVTLVGGPTALLEVGGSRLLTDPTFDPSGTRYTNGPVELTKTTAPALAPGEIGGVDAVLPSHDQHYDNLDHAGRKFLGKAQRVLTTPSAAKRLGGNAVGLAPWESSELSGGSGESVRVTAVPAQHGPEGTEQITGEVTGFVVEWGGRGRAGTLYVSGDTVNPAGVKEVACRFEVGIAILHLGAAGFEALGPVRLSMSADDAARAARILGARTVIPIHYEGWAHFTESREEAERAFAAAGAEERVLWLVPGTPTRISVA